MDKRRNHVPTPPGRFAATLPIARGREGGKVAAASSMIYARAKAQAKRLRRTLTGPEAKLWVHLKDIRTVDTHFRKQVPIGPYVADFACLRGKLVVEVDGFQHAFHSERRRDNRRTEMDAVLNAIYAHLHGGLNVPVVSMSKRSAGRRAPSSPSMGEVPSVSEAEGVLPSNAGRI